MLNYFCFHISLPHSQIWVNLLLMDLQLHHKIGKENTASSYTNQLPNNNNKSPQISKSVFGLFCNIRIIVPCLLETHVFGSPSQTTSGWGILWGFQAFFLVQKICVTHSVFAGGWVFFPHESAPIAHYVATDLLNTLGLTLGEICGMSRVPICRGALPSPLCLFSKSPLSNC